MKITKTQIDYLRRRLEDIMDDKVRAFKKTQATYTDEERYADIYQAIKSGKLKLKPKAEVVKDARCWDSPYLSQFYDLSQFHDKKQTCEDTLDNYRDKLDKAMTDIMDKVVLSDLMIEEAVKEFIKL